MATPPLPIRRLLDDLKAAHAEFESALAAVEPALRDAPGLVGQWSARELVGHLGYWAGQATEAIHRAEQDELEAYGDDELSVDQRNEVVARVAREADFATVAARERSAYEAFAARLAGVDPEWLTLTDADGDALEEIIKFDGADHYREHTADLRAWFSGEPDADDDDADA